MNSEMTNQTFFASKAGSARRCESPCASSLIVRWYPPLTQQQLLPSENFSIRLGSFTIVILMTAFKSRPQSHLATGLLFPVF
jgi:hypothetical protein